MSTHQQASIYFKRQSREDLLRAAVPVRSDLPTKYHPVKNYLMVIPLPDQGQSEGGLVLPDRSRITYNEGHIVEKGRLCSNQFNVGDCITWNQSGEYRLEIEGVKFVLLEEANVLLFIPKAELETKPTTIGAAQSPEETFKELESLGHRSDD